MEAITPRNINVSKAGRTRLRVTAMPRNLKVMVTVDSSINVGKKFI